MEIEKFEIQFNKEIPKSLGRLSKIIKPKDSESKMYFRLKHPNNFVLLYSDGTFIYQDVEENAYYIASNKKFSVISEVGTNEVYIDFNI